MNKRITFELTQEEYDAVCKLWEQVKKSPIEPNTSLNFDDFCKEIVVSISKGPNLQEIFKDMNFEDIMTQINDIKNMFAAKKDTVKAETKKDEVPDDKKYKS